MNKTPLYDEHLALGGRMVEFAGWELPVMYSSITKEHLAVRQGVGIFDVSHMGEFFVRGSQALEYLRWVTLNDPARLKVGRAQYSMLPNDRGGVVDDIYVYRVADDEYLVVVNAANVEKDWAHMNELAGNFDVELENASANWALMALQGPRAEEVLQPLCDVELAGRRKNSTFTASVAGVPVRLARTGYTGEDGFEIFAAPEAAATVWRALIGAGAVPAGLGARDTLRLEAGFPLYGHELTDETNPRCTPLAWVIKDKGYYGRQAIESGDCRRRLVGLLMERGIPREGYRILRGGDVVGEVTSGTQSPVLKKGIALGWVESDAGTELEVEVRGKPLPARVVPTPFVELGKK
ncbi:glycine cleavage system aminomethyltransferase GcvT [Oceanithermus sp.]